MKPKNNTDDKTTVVMKNQDNETTVTMAGQGAKKSKAPDVSEDELKLIRSYWTSGTAALKRQAVSRYARLMNMAPERAEAALEEWAYLLDRSK